MCECEPRTYLGHSHVTIRCFDYQKISINLVRSNPFFFQRENILNFYLDYLSPFPSPLHHRSTHSSFYHVKIQSSIHLLPCSLPSSSLFLPRTHSLTHYHHSFTHSHTLPPNIDSSPLSSLSLPTPSTILTPNN